MATTSTVPTVKARLVTVFTTALATASASGGQVPTSYAWPGPSTSAEEQVFLGHHPELRDIALNPSHEIPNVKAGRKQREETYQVPVTVWVFDTDSTPDAAATVEARAYTLFGLLEDVLADDPQIGLAQGVIQWAKTAGHVTTLWPFNKGWACSLVFDVDVSARLT